MTERLVLEASVVDKFSRPLRDLRDRLNGVKAPPGARETTREFEAMQRSVRSAAAEVQNRLAASFAQFAGTTLGVGAAIETVRRAVTTFASTTNEMRTLAKETGLSVQAIQQLQAVAGRFDIPADTMKRALETFGRNAHEIARRRGDVYAQLLLPQIRGTGFTEKLIEALKSGDVDRAADMALDFIIQERQRNPQNAAKLAELLFGDATVARMGDRGMEAFKKAMQDMAAALRAITPEDIRRAEQFAEATSKLSEAFDRLKMSAGSSFAPGLADALNWLTDLLDRMSKLSAQTEKNPGAGLTEWLVKPIEGAIEALKRYRELRDQVFGNSGDQLKALKESRAENERQIAEEERRGPSPELNMLRQNRDRIDEQIRKLEEAVKKGASEGVKDAFEKMSFRSGGAYGGATFQRASLGRAAIGGMGAAGEALRGFGRGDTPSGRAGAAARESAQRVRSLFGDDELSGDAFLNLIGKAEGTDKGRGYNETLAYGRLTGGPVDLTGMTLNEVDQLQTSMLRHPANRWNSSAVGRYQIVRSTLRGLRRQLGLSGDELYDEGMQDRLAKALQRRRGPDVAGLRNEWEGLRRVPGESILAAYHAGRRQVERHGPMRPAPDVGLWTKAREAGVAGGGIGNIGGAATLDVTLNGFPRKVSTSADGGSLFRSVDVERGRSMVAAEGDI